jgi:hypothetical protein
MSGRKPLSRVKFNSGFREGADDDAAPSLNNEFDLFNHLRSTDLTARHG